MLTNLKKRFKKASKCSLFDINAGIAIMSTVSLLSLEPSCFVVMLIFQNVLDTRLTPSCQIEGSIILLAIGKRNVYRIN